MVDNSSIVNWELNHKNSALKHIPRIIAFLGYDPTAREKPESLGERIRLKRRRPGLSLKELARVPGNRREQLAGLGNWST
jgi:hypothetical protein